MAESMGDRLFGFLSLDFAKRQVQTAMDAAAKIVSDECDEESTQQHDVTPVDIEFAEGLTTETFTAFPRDKLDDAWIMVPAQEVHARTLLERCPNIRHVRFELCPKRMKDEDFWQIYFIIVRRDTMAAAADMDGYLLLDPAEEAASVSSEPVFLPGQDSYLGDEASNT